MGIGDEVMASGQAAIAQRSDPRKVRLLYEGKTRWHLIWDNNPRLAKPSECGDFQIVHAREGWKRSYIEAKDPFKWTWRAYQPPRGEIYFSDSELDFGSRYEGRIVFEPTVRLGASPNKDWGWDRWTKLAVLFNQARIPFTQLGPERTKLLPLANWIRTPTVRHAAAILRYARVAIVHEGGLHHICAALDVPCFVIRGGYITSRVTGYVQQVNFETEGLGCGSRIRCRHCEEAMSNITPEMVFKQFLKSTGLEK